MGFHSPASELPTEILVETSVNDRLLVPGTYLNASNTYLVRVWCVCQALWGLVKPATYTLHPAPYTIQLTPCTLGLVGSTDWRGTTRAEDAQGTPTQSHISPNILVYEDNKAVAPMCELSDAEL